jgi:hypothetical protein
MNLNVHPAAIRNLAGTHAFLSPSSPSWVNYDEDKLNDAFFKAMAAKKGTELHELAHRAITLGVKLMDDSTTLSMYVNDAIGYRMNSEQLLYYSPNCYGHADAVSFRNHTLRIHDLKTGTNNCSFVQLEIYAALFCLEYKEFVQTPFDIKMELRIYQNDDIKIHFPDPDDIFHIMEKIKRFDKILSELRLEY